MGHGGGGWLTRIASVGVFAVLVVTLVVGVAPNFDTRLVELAETAWPGYAADLRSDPEQPECDLEGSEARANACVATAAPAGAADPFGGKDPFAAAGSEPAAADPFAGKDPFAEPAAADPFAGKDPFAEPAAQPAAPDPFAGEDPFAAPAGGDPFGGDDPFAAAPATSAGPSCEALRSLADTCRTRHESYNDIASRLTGPIRAYRAVELTVAGFARFGGWRDILVLLVLAGAAATTWQRAHIALREPKALLEHRVAQGSQLIAYLLLLASNVADWQVQQGSTAEIENPELPVIWAGGLAVLAAINIWHIARPPAGELEGRSSVARVLMVVPLYAWMAMISGAWFLLIEGHPSGQAIYLHKFVQHPSIYLGIGLYIWAGMLLSVTRLAPLAFDLLTPWRLPPALLAWLVVVLAALPTAYSGASGIFVIAAGAVIFERLRAGGASPRVALAATAMSGSLGVVLRPCLVVVLIAVLNKQVTTDELFSRGLVVFALTAALSLIGFLAINRQPFRMASPAEGLSGMARAARPLVPYALLGTGAVLAYRLLLDTPVNEHTAALVLPGVMLAIVAFDRRGDKPLAAALEATRESSGHIGALLVLMACSVGLGGVVERAEVMSIVPSSFGSPFLTMTFLVAVMVLVGMTMDALGAVVLVSVTVANVAYTNGIDPVHFWMMVLVAFELGYLTPPVAINHLLARQVIGEPAHVEDDDVEGFAARYQHVLLPMAVMGTALLIVAYVPLFWGA